MINYLKNQGISQKTLDFVVIVTVIFMAVFAASLIFIILFDNFTNRTVQPWVPTTLGIFVTFGVTLITGHATTSQINGTAAKAASQVATAWAQQQSTNNSDVSVVQQNTQAIKENTVTTQANTQIEKEHLEHG